MTTIEADVCAKAEHEVKGLRRAWLPATRLVRLQQWWACQRPAPQPALASVREPPVLREVRRLLDSDKAGTKFWETHQENFFESKKLSSKIKENILANQKKTFSTRLQASLGESGDFVPIKKKTFSTSRSRSSSSSSRRRRSTTSSSNSSNSSSSSNNNNSSGGSSSRSSRSSNRSTSTSTSSSSSSSSSSSRGSSTICANSDKSRISQSSSNSGSSRRRCRR